MFYIVLRQNFNVCFTYVSESCLFSLCSNAAELCSSCVSVQDIVLHVFILCSNAVKAIKSVFTERIARHQVLFVKPLPPPRSSPSPSLSQDTGCSSCSASQHWENSATTMFITIITKIVITILILILITVYMLLQRSWQLGVAYLEVQLPPN